MPISFYYIYPIIQGEHSKLCPNNSGYKSDGTGKRQEHLILCLFYFKLLSTLH